MEQQNNSLQQIDIEKIFHEKSPKLARWIPRFVMRYIKKIAHEDFLNDIIRNYGHLQGFDFSEAMIKKFNLTLEVNGEENLPPAGGRYVFVSNHPLGGLDGHVIMYLVGKKYGAYKFLVNDILMGLKNLQGVFIPVNKHGKQGVEFAKQVDEAYNSDLQLLTFPAGLVSRRINGQIVDLPWQKNFIVKARQYQRDVIPIHISGQNTNFFYRLANLRKKLGIKANIEMLYLIDETYKHVDKHLVINFGKPIPWQTFNNSKKPKEWAKYVKEVVYKMAGMEKLPF